ncbi:MAG: cytochrome P460 family protein [Anaerolineae bacterium]|nr:cytochrome P460 family protein [Anaerolineae bacterium]
MKPPIFFALLALALIGLVVYSGMNRQPTMIPVTPIYPPGREPMTLPPNYRETFDLYAIVDRPDAITRKIYIDPAAVAAVSASEDLPERTQIVVEAFDAARDANGSLLRDERGHFIPADLDPAIHVAELRSTWQIEDLAASSHVGDWNFASFDDATGAPFDEPLSDCFSCHDGASRRDFVFTQAELQRYARTGETQYRYCPAPGRVPC